MNWFLYDNGLRRERVKEKEKFMKTNISRVSRVRTISLI